MGEPAWGNAQALHPEHIGVWRERGEPNHPSTLRKRNNSPSSGERKGNSPNPTRAQAYGRCALGVAAPAERPYPLKGVTNLASRGRVWNDQPERVIVPYPKEVRLLPVGQSTTGHANPVGSRGVHSPRLNTSWRPIVNEYQ
jgi:hypothetical protein